MQKKGCGTLKTNWQLAALFCAHVTHNCNTIIIYTLPETNKSHLNTDGWNIKSSFGSRPIFKAFAVSFRGYACAKKASVRGLRPMKNGLLLVGTQQIGGMCIRQRLRRRARSISHGVPRPPGLNKAVKTDFIQISCIIVGGLVCGSCISLASCI